MTDTSGLKRFLGRLNKVADMAKSDSTILERIVEAVAIKGAEILEKKYGNIDYDISANPLPTVTYTTENNYGFVQANGIGVAYIEFGTGRVGEKSATADTLENKAEAGALGYNTGKTIKLMRVQDGLTKGGNPRYIKDLAWVKPRRAMTMAEQSQLEDFRSRASHRIPSERLGFAVARQEKFIRRTQGIVAGNQIYDTARELEAEIPKIVAEIVRKELA